MSSIFAAVINIIQNRRTCPKCGMSQMVPRDKREDTVTCKNCGAKIPPPHK